MRITKNVANPKTCRVKQNFWYPERVRFTWTALAAAGFAGSVCYAVKGKSAQIFGPSVYRGQRSRRSIALTFDDGPSEGSLKLLSYLADQEVSATFFQCGMNVIRHPEIARAIAQAGHELGNHTFSHPRLAPRLGRKVNLRSPAFIDREFSQTQDLILSVTGVRPALLRAPYGMRWFGMRPVQQRLRLLGVMWTVIGRDWEWTADQVAQHVLSKAGPGGIVCLHDGRDVRPNPDITQTIQAVQKIVPVLKRRGYRFETVSRLITK